MDLRRLRSSAFLIAILVIAFCLPLVIKSAYILALIIPGLMWAVTCMGWATVFRVGQFSLGQAGFMAIGAYISALLAVNFHLSVWLGLLLGGLISALVALLLGMALLRLAGLYFAIVTLAFCEIIRVIAMNLTSVTRGVYGLIAPAPSLVIGSYAVDFTHSRVPYYYLFLLLVIIAALAFWRIDHSRLGRIFQSVSSDGTLSEHVGIHLMKYRVIAFTVAGFFSGIAGALYAHYMHFIGPTVFTFVESVMVVIMCTVGGTASAAAGPIIGAMLLSPLGDFLTSLTAGLESLLVGIIVVVVVFLLPGGLVDLRQYFSRGVTKLKGILTPAEGSQAEIIKRR